MGFFKSILSFQDNTSVLLKMFLKKFQVISVQADVTHLGRQAYDPSTLA